MSDTELETAYSSRTPTLQPIAPAPIAPAPATNGETLAPADAPVLAPISENDVEEYREQDRHLPVRMKLFLFSSQFPYCTR
jgi:hypothetical protein